MVTYGLVAQYGFDLALDALNMAIWQRTHAGDDLSGLIHHSDRGVQYRALRYTERLEEQDLVASVGSRGDSYDNALAETINGLYKAELIHRRAPWKTKESLELATLEWVWWWNHQRLHGELDMRTPLEVEQAYYADLESAHPAIAGQGNR